MYMVWSMADQSNVNKGKKFKTFSSKSFVKNLPGLVFFLWLTLFVTKIFLRWKTKTIPDSMPIAYSGNLF